MRFKATMLKSGFCNYGGAQILVRGEMAIIGAGGEEDAKQADKK